MAVVRLTLGTSPDGDWGVEYNDANGRVTRVWATGVARGGRVVMANGQAVEQTIDTVRPINVPGTQAKVAFTADGWEFTGIDSFAVG